MQLCTDHFFPLLLLIAPKYRFVACLIQKSLSTLLETVMCLLFDEERFLARNRTLHTEFGETRLCLHQNEINNYVSLIRRALRTRFGMEDPAALDTFHWLAIVRDPVERFLSGFVDKCIRQPRAPNFCLGCGANLSCFVHKEYARMLAESRRVAMERTWEDMHFFPQSWRCNFRTLFANYTLLRVPNPRMQRQPFVDQLMTFLVHQIGIGPSIAQFLRQQLDPSAAGGAARTLHTTDGTRVREFIEQRLRASPYLMEFVVRMFWYDFRLFGFPVPDMAFLS